MGWIAILACYKFHFIREHDNMVFDPSNKNILVNFTIELPYLTMIHIIFKLQSFTGRVRVISPNLQTFSFDKK